jgi:AcrR family transcriptional regulator
MARVKGVSPDVTKNKILTSARVLFVEHGFSGTSMGKIAKHAAINHSLIFHHFENKKGLWLAVKMQIVEEAREQVETLPRIDLPFKEFLNALVHNNVLFYRDNRDIVRMIQWQRLEYNEQSGAAFGKSKETQRWLSAFEHYQKRGDINADFDLGFVLTLIISIISSAAMDPIAFIEKPAAQKKYFSFVVERILAALL